MNNWCLVRKAEAALKADGWTWDRTDSSWYKYFGDIFSCIPSESVWDHPEDILKVYGKGYKEDEQCANTSP